MNSEKPSSILIVDDVAANVEYLEALLASFHVNIISATSGLEALEKIKGEELAVALVDIRMRRMSGIDLARKIAEDTNRDKVPIIFVTAYTQDEDQLSLCYEAGGVDYILKPFKKEILVSKVKIFLDLNKQKHQIVESKKSLEQSERLYRSLLNASPEGIVIMDLNGIVTEVSDISLELFEVMNKSQFIGVSFYSLLNDNESVKFKEVLDKTMEIGLVQNVEFILFTWKHVQLITEISTTLIQESDGTPRAYMAIIRDIRIRKELEQQLIQSERLSAIGEVAASIAHEINQPLNNISLSLENLLLEISNNKTMDVDYLQQKSSNIFDNIHRMEHIVEHVRAFSRGLDDTFLGHFDINESIRNAVMLVSEQFNNKAIGLITKLEEGLPPLKGNTYKFEQVMINLLVNAKDAIEEKKSSTSQLFETSVSISTALEDRFVVIEVGDNGCGILPGELDKIMFPFYSTKKAGKGTGLGLSITAKIIKEMNGTIHVESEAGTGTLIGIRLPIENHPDN